MNSQNFDPVFEAMLRQAVRDNVYEEAASVPDDETLATMFTISQKHDKRMRHLCAREDRREMFSAFMRPAKNVAVFALVAITVLFGALMLNIDARAAVKEVIIEWYEQFTRFVGIGDVEPNGSRDWSPEYLPDGYVEVNVFESTLMVKEYENDDGGYFTFQFFFDSNELQVDNEESEYSTEEINGIIYYVFEAEDERKSCRITWFADGYTFNISGYLDVEELLEIAKSVK